MESPKVIPEIQRDKKRTTRSGVVEVAFLELLKNEYLFIKKYLQAQNYLEQMNNHNLETLSAAINELTNQGYEEDFKALESTIQALYSKKEYQPHELKITETYRFEGMTDPADQTVLFAMKANDGVKGTLTMTYSYNESQNQELIHKIKQA